MAICPSCKGTKIEYDSTQGNSICISCGAVVEENSVVSEVTFSELSNGASVLEGQFIASDKGKAPLPTIFGRRVGDVSGPSGTPSLATTLGPDGKPNGQLVSAESREITLANGRRRIQALAGAVGLSGDHMIETAYRWYSLALQHQFTRGRRGPNIIAACLYIVSRQERTPHMLLDFADILSTSVYSLGGTFLRLVRLLNLEIPIVDPSFFVARFASRLEFGDKTSLVANTALRLVARMKRDWIQAGRRPAGVCGAALVIAARMHGFRRTQSEIVRVVRVCEATLRKRLDEFGETPSSQLTPQEFEGIWLEQESNPPSFTPHSSTSNTDNNSSNNIIFLENNAALEELEGVVGSVDTGLVAPEITEQKQVETEIIIPSIKLQRRSESANLSDVEFDEEMEGMMLSKDEVLLKTRLWTEMNTDYLEKEKEKQRIKFLDASASLKSGHRSGSNGKDGVYNDNNNNDDDDNDYEDEYFASPNLMATKIEKALSEGVDGAIVVGTIKKDDDVDDDEIVPFKRQSTRRPKRKTTTTTATATGTGKESKTATAGKPTKKREPHTTPAEAAKVALQSKRLSKKINYDALDDLFNSSTETAKKQ